MEPTIVISGIRFPKQIIDALSRDRLVVFAGAGVSAGAPACLPDFGELAKVIAQGSGEEISDDETEDQFLGRLQHRGQDVYKRAKEAILSYDAEPTALHGDLLRLFRDESAVRLVTTNFDMLFEDAAKKLFESPPEVFSAPALPLGSNFSGIIHVHGSMEREQDIVLTDSDFGRAYLTEGWARRFLVEMFRFCTVLFIGYSHRDTVMKYLARALPTETERFALTSEPEMDLWRILNISPIAYSMPVDNNHGALNEGISGLATHVNRGVFDWQRVITEIASRPPQDDEETSDLIRDVLSEPSRAHFFTEAARHPEWIEWLDDRHLLDGLFEAGSGTLDEVDNRLATWLAERFALNHAADVMHLLASHNLHIHPVFWSILARTVRFEKEQALDNDTLSRWVSLLIASAPPLNQHPWTSSELFFLGERCADADLPDSLVEIFARMASIDLTIRSLRPFLRDDDLPASSSLVPTVETGIDHYHLNDLWTRKLKPRIEEFAETLLDVAVQALENQYRVLVAWQSANPNWDAASFRRSAIEPHEQNVLTEPTDALIDVARDCLEYLTSKRPNVASHWCEILVRKEANLLRRLAVHVLPLRDDLNGDEKADWLLDRIGLHEVSNRHETYRAMYGIYPGTSRATRSKIINGIQSFEWPPSDVDDGDEQSAYVQFRWIHWLLQSAPDCSLLRESLEEIQIQHPEFRPPDHPEFTSYTSEFIYGTPQSPWIASELVERPARTWIDELLSFKDDWPVGPNREGLVVAIEEAATQQVQWGFDLAEGLADSQRWETDIWPPLMRAWSVELDADLHRQVLALISHEKLYAHHARPVTDLLCSLVRSDGPTYSAELLPEVNRLASEIWDHAAQAPLLVSPGNRFFQAVNHPAGNLAQFWLNSLEISLKQQNSQIGSLGNVYNVALTRITREDSLAGQLGKATLARQLAFLFAANEEWTGRHLLPLFTCESIADRQAVWHGFLYGRPNPQVAEVMSGPFLSALPSIQELFSEDSDLRRQFVSFFASMSVYFVEDPLDNWIPEFFRNVEPEDKERLAWAIGDILASAEDARRREWWDRWIRRYWENRLQGVPFPLEPVEIKAMVGWLPKIGALFPEAVELALKMQPTPLKNSFIIHQLYRGDWWSMCPEATAKLVIWIAYTESPSSTWHEGGELIAELLKRDLPEELTERLREIPALLGWRNGY